MVNSHLILDERNFIEQELMKNTSFKDNLNKDFQFKFYLQTFIFFYNQFSTPHTISTSIVTLILLFSTLLTLFLHSLSKL